jgi:hypothetical protein
MHYLKEAHFQVAKQLMQEYEGHYIKDLGDGILGYFFSPEKAVIFATALQSLDQTRPGLSFSPLGIKIGMAHRAVIIKDGVPEDVDGKGANLGQRVQTMSESGQVILEKGTYEFLCDHWSRVGCDKLVKDIGEHQLRGFELEPLERLWSFDWQTYNSQQNVVGSLVGRQLDRAHFVLTNSSNVPLHLGGNIFWPVSGRQIATAIHRGQIEAMRLLAICGWTIHLFITDSEYLFDEKHVPNEDFQKQVEAYAATIGVKIAEVEYISRLFSTSRRDLPDLLSRFNKSASSITVAEVLEMEGKAYPDRENLVKKRSLLKFLRPTFTTVAFLKFVNDNAGDKIMVVAGYDESARWTGILRDGFTNQMNMVFNPILTKGSNTELQGDKGPFWYSKEELIEAMADTNTNLMEWAYNLFVLLPKFPSGLSICQRYCDPTCGKTLQDCPNIQNIRDRVAMDVKGKCWE